MIAGTFADASGVHGFSYQSGVWTQIDYPGSSDTEVYGINSTGTIVGTYDGSQPVTHAFVLQNGQYQRIDTPFGTQAIALAINDLGSIAGVGYTDPVSGPSTAFILSRAFPRLAFPTRSIVNSPQSTIQTMSGGDFCRSRWNLLGNGDC